MAKPVYDVVIVGSGAGGGASAYALANAGLTVMLLESGPVYDPHIDYRLDQSDWERGAFPNKVNVRDRQTVAELQTPIRVNRVRSVRVAGPALRVDAHRHLRTNA